MVTLTDLSLEDIDLQGTLPRLGRMRERHFRLKPEICLELPRNITRFMRAWENDPAQRTDSAELRAGKLYQYVMGQKAAIIADEDESLLAGTTTSKPLGVILYPDLAALFLWPELETVANRPKNPFKITVEEIRELNEEIFPYWLDKTILEVTRADNHNPLCRADLRTDCLFHSHQAGQYLPHRPQLPGGGGAGTPGHHRGSSGETTPLGQFRGPSGGMGFLPGRPALSKRDYHLCREIESQGGGSG